MIEFQEEAFVPANPILVSLEKKIKDKGFVFHPYLVTSAIQVEMERQLKSLIEKTFKDMNMSQLVACSNEVNEYAEKEEARYQSFQSEQEKAKANVLKPMPSIDEVVKSSTEEFENSQKPKKKK